uniref:cystathionine gamma-lyase n=1 Tax=Meloidogyne javanica TaxID=6303 RepID=A0A915MMU4_MELJA
MLIETNTKIVDPSSSSPTLKLKQLHITSENSKIKSNGASDLLHTKLEEIVENNKIENKIGNAFTNGNHIENAKKRRNFSTTAIHAGIVPQRWDMHQVVPPISLSTTYRQPNPGEPIGHDYSRAGNPTRDVLEETIAALEEGKFARVFASGLSATSAMANWINTGEHIILSDDGYGGTQRLFRTVSQAKHGVELSFVDLTKPEELRKALKSNTRMVWFESPSNPLLKVVDIRLVVQIVKEYDPNILVVVDNTFMSPFFQKPLLLGADAVLHSITKYINGHSDVVMGVLVTNIKELDKHLNFQQLAVGAIPSAFDTYLVIRGIKTLHLRMKQHMENALTIAKWLEEDARIERVLYPELESHPQHLIHKKQSSGMSGMISFYLRGAESLGGYESLAELPSVMTHASVPADIRKELGIGDNLIRLSVGCEDSQDLIDDLDQALSAAIVSNFYLELGK